MNTPQVSEFVKNVKRDTEIYSEIHSILRKSETEGYLHYLHITLSNIFQQEMKLSIIGKSLDFHQSQSKIKMSLIENEMKSSLIIFKENLKLILDSSGFMKSGKYILLLD